MRAVAGLALAAAHLVGFVVLAPRCDGTELAVEVRGPAASPVVALDGVVPPALAARVRSTLDTPAGPGLQRRRWTVRYRGGYERSVGAAQLVGPFQDPAARACMARVVVSQRLLDDGAAGPSSIAGQLVKLVEAELAGEEVFPAGAFRRVSRVAVQWARLEWHPWDRGFIGDAPHGYVRAELTIAFDRVDIPVVVALIPAVATTDLGFRIATRAELTFDNRVAQWVSDKLGGNRMATKIARGHVDGVLISALAPPPPLPLPGGHALRFGFCGAAPEIVEGRHGALGFTVELGAATDPGVRPPRRGPAPRRAIADTAALALDLDLDALDAVLFELWRIGYLDRELAAAGLDTRFNTDPLVAALLSIRVSPPRLALPPTVAPSGTGLRLAADARVTITDQASATTGRVWGALDFSIGDALAPIGVELGALALSCERTATTLVPCYADLVAAMRERGPEFHGALTTAFATILTQLFVERRLADPLVPVEIVIRRAIPHLVITGTNGSLHLDLEAALHSKP